MSHARGNGQNGGHFYSNITQPVKIDMNFVVDSANGNGLGIRSLKSNGYVQNVFMHTSTTPGSNNGYLNPNPLSGYALIQFKNNFKVYLGGFSGFVSPTSGSAGGSVTISTPAIIASLGTTTLAQWQAAGVPVGLTPAVGMSFIAIKTGAIGGTGTIIASGVSGISSVEVIGDPNVSINSYPISTAGGAWLMVQFLGASFAGSALATHTHNFTVIGGQAASTTNNIANYAGPIIGKQEATNATYLGSASATNGGVVAASAGTPAGSVSFGPVAPADNSTVGLSAFFDISSVSIDGL